MLVLEGAQGILKSSTLRALAVKDAWFADRLSHLHSKDASMETAGVLLVEIAEMDALTRASSSAMKSFLTRTHERIRLPFGKRTIKWGRQCIFAGSINPTAGGYLRDPTGARRIWPVACGNGGNAKIDRDGIERDRNQLWAEAVAKYKSGAKWWLETPELEKLATAEQAARFELDVWEARKLRVVHWLKEKNEISLPEVLKEALGITEKDQIYHSAEIRVANILKNVGFTKCRPRKGDDRKYEYQRANSGNNPDHQDHPDQKDHQ